jgi:hypothetical protein
MAIPASLYSLKVPGGSLVAALLDRRLQAWSDRGGASQELGTRWSKLVAEELSHLVGQSVPFGGTRTTGLRAVVWLDGRPEIAQRAGRNGLVNPDLVLVHDGPAGTVVLQPADAKFAVQMVKLEQISARALRALFDSRDPLLLQELSRWLPDMPAETVEVIDGFVVSPAGLLTEHYLPRLVARRGAQLRRDQVVTLPADPRRLFAGLPVARLVGLLAAIDRLAVRPSRDLVAAVYYVRLACACRWLWEEQRRPLLSLDSRLPADLEGLSAEVAARARGAETAFGLIERWVRETQEMRRDRATVARVASPPVRAAELRDLFARAGLESNRRLEREIRAELTSWYRGEVIARMGEIPARPARPLVTLVQDLARLSRELEPLVRQWLEERVRSAC